MGSQSYTWTIRDRGPGFTKTVVFWHPEKKRQVERSTHEKDPERAKARAPSIIAKELAGTTAASGRRSCVELPTEKLAAEWIDSLRGILDDGTLASYALSFSSHLVDEFPSLLDVTTPRWRQYIKKRLAKVQAATVRKELTPMRALLLWCEENGKLESVPHLPGVPKKALGTQYEKRRRVKADPLSPDQVEAIIAALPEWDDTIGPVRPRFELQYEMGLRSSVLDRLSKPEHWREGRDRLQIPAKHMKARKASDKLLTARAKSALERACKTLESGLIFGRQDYREHVAAAAMAAVASGRLPEDWAERFAPTHLRSAAITHFLDAGAPLTAAQAFADHKLATTTDRYVRASQRALEAELKRQGRA